MIVTRLGVSISPVPVLSVEFQRDKELFVWRVEIRNTKPVADIVLDLKAQFPEYLGKVPISQLHRLIKFGLKLSCPDDLNKLSQSELLSAKSKMNLSFEKNRISKDSDDFVYDYRIDFPKPDDAKLHQFDMDDSPVIKSR